MQTESTVLPFICLEEAKQLTAQITDAKTKFNQNRYCRAMCRLEQKGDQVDIVKSIQYSVRFLNSYQFGDTITYIESIMLYGFLLDVKMKMQQLTPAQFISAFPVNQTCRKHCANNFFTNKNIKDFVSDEPLGNNLGAFIIEYDNRTIRDFLICGFEIIDIYEQTKLRKGIWEVELELDRPFPTLNKHPGPKLVKKENRE